jgi:hypothetical protein
MWITQLVVCRDGRDKDIYEKKVDWKLDRVLVVENISSTNPCFPSLGLPAFD